MSKKKKGDSKKDKKKKESPKVNEDLKGFNIKIDQFGEIHNSYDIDKINDFLNKNVEDKKLQEREDYKDLRSGKKKQSKDEDEDKEGNSDDNDEKND